MSRKLALRPTLATAAVLGVSLVLAGCSGGDAEADDAPAQEEAPAEEAQEDAAEAAPAAEEDAPAAEGGVPSWAKEPTEGGDQIATVEAGDVTVDVFQMGTAPAPKDGNWVDPDTDEPLIAEGDDLVFVN